MAKKFSINHIVKNRPELNREICALGKGHAFLNSETDQKPKNRPHE